MAMKLLAAEKIGGGGQLGMSNRALKWNVIQDIYQVVVVLVVGRVVPVEREWGGPETVVHCGWALC